VPCQAHVEPCRGMACQAHAVACQALVVACLVPMIWHVKPYRSMPCQAHVVACLVKALVVTCLVEPMSRHVEPMLWHACLVKPMSWHALCQFLGMSSRVVACLVKPMSWRALSRPCRANVEARRAHVVACMPCQTHVVACIVTMSWHVKPCGCMPCHVSCDCPVTSTSRAMAWPLQPHSFSFMHLSRSLCRGPHVIFRAIALCPYRGMPFAHVVACLFKPMSWVKHLGFRFSHFMAWLVRPIS
jgi:hypothetical protein